MKRKNLEIDHNKVWEEFIVEEIIDKINNNQINTVEGYAQMQPLLRLVLSRNALPLIHSAEDYINSITKLKENFKKTDLDYKLFKNKQVFDKSFIGYASVSVTQQPRALDAGKRFTNGLSNLFKSLILQKKIELKVF